MFCRHLVVALFLLFGALLSVITLISGCKPGVIRNAALAIVRFSCALNTIANDDIVQIRLNFHRRLWYVCEWNLLQWQLWVGILLCSSLSGSVCWSDCKSWTQHWNQLLWVYPQAIRLETSAVRSLYYKLWSSKRAVSNFTKQGGETASAYWRTCSYLNSWISILCAGSPVFCSWCPLV